jgi:hypothetical protein
MTPPPTTTTTTTTTAARNWRACKRRFMGAHPWPVRVFEISTADPVTGAGAVAILTKDAVGPREPVSAFFALAGAWRRDAGNGWVDHTGQPARPSPERVQSAWVDLKRLFESNEYAFADVPATTMHEELGGALALLGERNHATDALAPFYVARIGPKKSWGDGHIAVDGRTSASRAVALPVQPPFVRAVRICAAWNDRWFLGETSTQWVLVHWSTSA